jgi:hypothetical protein
MSMNMKLYIFINKTNRKAQSSMVLILDVRGTGSQHRPVRCPLEGKSRGKKSKAKTESDSVS